MRYCSTWLSSLLCYIKNFVIEEFVIRVLHCTWTTSVQIIRSMYLYMFLRSVWVFVVNFILSIQYVCVHITCTVNLR